MKLELRELNGTETVLVPEEGLTFGRAGGNAQHLIRDAGVSKRHARIWGEGGSWFLEDLGSSNGTIFEEQRITEPIEILPGDVFAFSKVKFEVVRVVDGPAPANGANGAGGPSQDVDSAVQAKGARPPSGSVGKEATASKPSRIPAKRDAAKAKRAAAEAEGQEESPEPKSAAQLPGVVLSAIAFYLAAIPLLLINPLHAVRKGIENQRHAAKGPIELVGYAIPPLLLSALLGSFAAGIAGAVRGAFSLASFFPVVSIIVAFIGAVIAGLVWHPVLRWVVDFFKGTSTDRSRTNFFLMTMTGSAALAVPNALGVLLSLVQFRLIGLVGVLLTAVASLAMAFITYSWFAHFEVVKWFRTLLLVLGGLSVVGAVAQGATVLTSPAKTTSTAVASEGSDSSSDRDSAVESAKSSEDVKGTSEKTGEDAKKRPDDGKGAATKSAAETKATADDSKSAQEKAAADAKARAEEAKAAEAAKRASDVKTVAETQDRSARTQDTDDSPSAAQPRAPQARIEGTGFPAWKARREFIEKKIADDPTLLTSVAGLKPLYQAVHLRQYEVEGKFGRLTARKPADAVLNGHLRDIELFEKTNGDMTKLYLKLRNR